MGRSGSVSAFQNSFDVSRETMDLLDRYVELIVKWNKSINLVSKTTISDIWDRHIADSAQLFSLVDIYNIEKWLDVGSGGGLPGIVIAILAKEKIKEAKVVLVESDSRKCAFLRTVTRDLGLNVEVIEDRIEAISPVKADVVSARAFAGLDKLMELSSRHGKADAVCLFLKGQTHNAELTLAQESWNIEVESLQSMTDSSARILKIKGITRADERRT